MRFALLLLLAAPQGTTDPVKLDTGLISGTESDGVRIYKGIPYAAPPIGPLRWKAPQPATPWAKVRACTSFGAACPQPRQEVIGTPPDRTDEDCLTLNVWTAARTAGERRPVMVWIHGGGWTTGAGSFAVYDGTSFAKAGVVLVTINYRLGPFGYLAHPLLSRESEHGVSGNYGMLDQIAALEWVRRNIAAFGGNPDCVTIFGESAGGGSVARLLVSPPAKGLFHRAIAQSGVAHGRTRHLRETWYGLEPMEKVGERIAATLGCTDLSALRAKSADEILAAAEPSQGLFGHLEKGTKFGPVVDGRVLPDDPGGLFDAGRLHDVPVIIGTNADEGTIFLKQLPVKNTAGYKALIRAFWREHADAILALFPAAGDDDVLAALNRVVTDAVFVAPSRMLARAVARKGASRAWLYHFTRVPPAASRLKLGAFHGLEIMYAFNNMEGTRLGIEQADRDVAAQMHAAWVRFATTGDPNGGKLPAWPAHDAAGDSHMDFGNEIKAGKNLRRESCDLFEKVLAADRKHP